MYRNEFSFRSGMSQEEILAYDWDNQDRIYQVRNNTATTPDIQFQPYLENPLEYGYRRIGLSGALRYLAHPAYQEHALFLTKSV